MHRSGTSAMAEALVAAGAWFGKPQIAAGATAKRPLGLVERKDILALTKATLEAQACSWHDIGAFQAKRMMASAEPYQNAFVNGALADLAQHPLSVLKDPRLCLLLPMFRPVMPETYGVMIVRHPLEVAASLHARNDLPFRTGAALWEAYNRHALISLQGLPSLIVQHRRLMLRPGPYIGTVLQSLEEMGVRGLDPDAVADGGTINENAYRQRATLLNNRKLAPSQRDFWKVLREAQLPVNVPIEELSPESRTALEEHHAHPIVRQLARTQAITA